MDNLLYSDFQHSLETILFALPPGSAAEKEVYNLQIILENLQAANLQKDVVLTTLRTYAQSRTNVSGLSKEYEKTANYNPDFDGKDPLLSACLKVNVMIQPQAILEILDNKSHTIYELLTPENLTLQDCDKIIQNCELLKSYVSSSHHETDLTSDKNTQNDNLTQYQENIRNLNKAGFGLVRFLQKELYE